MDWAQLAVTAFNEEILDKMVKFRCLGEDIALKESTETKVLGTLRLIQKETVFIFGDENGNI